MFLDKWIWSNHKIGHEEHPVETILVNFDPLISFMVIWTGQDNVGKLWCLHSIDGHMDNFAFQEFAKVTKFLIYLNLQIQENLIL